MSQKAKPKRKNLSPDDLLQEARLLYPENEAFVRGESKELHPKMTIFANIRRGKYNFSGNRTQSIVATLFLLIPSVFIGSIFVRSMVLEHTLAMKFVSGFISLLVWGWIISLVHLLWKFFTFNEVRILRDFTNLIQQGELVSGEVMGLPLRRVEVDFYSLHKGKKIQIFWYDDSLWDSYTSGYFKTGDKVIVLYVDDKLCIVL